MKHFERFRALAATALVPVALCVALMPAVGCGSNPIGKILSSVDPVQVETGIDLVGAILYDAANIAAKQGAIDKATGEQIYDYVAQIEGYGNAGNIEAAKRTIATVIRLLPAGALTQAEAQAGTTINAEVQAVGGGDA